VDRADLDPILGHERRRGVVLRRERVRRAQRRRRAPGLERAHQVGRLGGDVKARRYRYALERSLAVESFAHLPEDRHLALGPRDPVLPGPRQIEVGYIVGRGPAPGHRL
jgi:hypothetical protein